MKKIISLLSAVCVTLTAAAAAGCSGSRKAPSIKDTVFGSAARTTAEETEKPETAARPAYDPEADYSPVFSVESGFLTEAAELRVTPPDYAPLGVYVTYTLNGNEPNSKSRSDGAPITVGRDDCTVVRAACFDVHGNQISRIVTASYLKADEKRFNTLVVSLTSDYSSLYGGSGIIDNPTSSGKNWERPCHVEIFESAGTKVVDQDAGLRIFGGSSRVLPQKSFRLIARKDGYYDESKYDGKGSFEYDFFPERRVIAGEEAGQPLRKYDRLILRNGGNDSLQHTAADPTGMTLTRDAAANAFFALHTENVAYQSSRFAAVFLNGDYYGILDLKEDINDDYIRNLYGLDKEQVTVIKSELDTSRHCDKHDSGGECRFDDVWFYYAVDNGPESELKEYETVCKAAVSALGGSEDELKKAYEELCRHIDPDNLLEYAAVCLYVCNTDWPHNNLRVWRYTGEPVEGNKYSDGRWRWTVRDMDFAFGRYECLVLPEIYTQADTDNISFTLGNYKNGGYEYDGNYPDSLYLQGLLALCLHDGDFRSRFLAFCETLCSDGSVESLKAAMDDLSGQISGEIVSHISRWQDTIDGGYDADVWKENTEKMKLWAEERPGYFREYLKFVEKNFK